MKTKLFTLAIVFSLFFISCEGPEGPPGFDGLDGNDGANGGIELSQVFEITRDFTDGNNFLVDYVFPSNTVHESDLILVYILWETVGDDAIWRLLPQSVLVDQGLLQYNYDHTYKDVNIFLDANFDLNTLNTDFTLDQTIRIAVVPGAFAQTSKMDTSNINEVMKKLGVSEIDVQKR